MEHQGLALLFKAKEAPVWIALCIDFDLMSQGDSEDEAIESLRWVVKTAADDDRAHRLDFWDRTPTTPERMLKYLLEHKHDAALKRVSLTV